MIISIVIFWIEEKGPMYVYISSTREILLKFGCLFSFSVEPMIWIPNQLVGAPIGSNVTLECHTDSSPKAIAYWIFNNNMVLNSFTHRAEDQFHSMYKLDSRLHIKNLQAKDFGSYKCVSKNSLGETEGSIMLYGE